MENEIVKYSNVGNLSDGVLEVLSDGVSVHSSDISHNLNVHNFGLEDLSGTFDDLGQLISYMRDLTESLKPVASNLNKLLEIDVPTFLKENKGFLIGGGVSVALILGYLGSGIVKNVLDTKRMLK